MENNNFVTEITPYLRTLVNTLCNDKENSDDDFEDPMFETDYNSSSSNQTPGLEEQPEDH